MENRWFKTGYLEQLIALTTVTYNRKIETKEEICQRCSDKIVKFLHELAQ
jgi:hypothetical protein